MTFPNEDVGFESEHIMQFFAYGHLRPDLQAVASPFCELAEKLVVELPCNPERTMALRKLLEAKDAAVRAFMAQKYTEMDRGS